MRVLHLVKTSDGAGWAAEQATRLVKSGVEVHVAVPQAQGRTVPQWKSAGAVIHVVPTDLPVRRPWLLPEAMGGLRRLVSEVEPDLIHSHFFASTILARLALGGRHRAIRIFQVPGPLHLEHRFWRSIDLSTAGPRDFWIGSSRCILAHYRAAGIGAERLYLSYYGAPIRSRVPRSGLLREKYEISGDRKVVGNANFIYPPKWYLGQRVGLKAHEDVIDALGMVIRQRPDVTGVLIGGTFAGSQWYERKLQARAKEVGGGRILMPGYVPMEEILRMWPDYDVAVHVPTSENCGGVVEPLFSAVPTIAGRVGGLPEVVMEGLTGTLVGIRDPGQLAAAVLRVLEEEEGQRNLAQAGCGLVRTMFDVERTGAEVFGIYRHLLEPGGSRPAEFDSRAYVECTARGQNSRTVLPH